MRPRSSINRFLTVQNTAHTSGLEDTDKVTEHHPRSRRDEISASNTLIHNTVTTNAITDDGQQSEEQSTGQGELKILNGMSSDLHKITLSIFAMCYHPVLFCVFEFIPLCLACSSLSNV